MGRKAQQKRVSSSHGLTDPINDPALIIVDLDASPTSTAAWFTPASESVAAP